jgi:hypothetical protein
MKRSEVRAFMNAQKGKELTVVFEKKDKTLRTMRCRIEPPPEYVKPISSRGAAYDFTAKGTYPVWDLDANGWRSFSIAGLQTIAVDGVTREVADDEPVSA